MTPQEWIAQNLGRGIDFDNHYSFQCMDVYRDYVESVLNFPQSLPVPGAADVWTTYLKEYFTQIKNEASNFPLPGDIIIYKRMKSNGNFGHIAIVEKADENTVTLIEQDGLTNSVLKRRVDKYVGCLGWLRAKKKEPIITEPSVGKVYSEEEFTKVRLERDVNWNSFQTEKEQHQKDLTDIAVALGCTNTVPGILARVKALTDGEEDSRQIVTSLKKEIDDLKGEKSDYLRQIDELRKQNEAMLKRLGELENDITITQQKESLLDRLFKFLKG